jgi:tetratricopeptide (TPR) repeat protein
VPRSASITPRPGVGAPIVRVCVGAIAALLLTACGQVEGGRTTVRLIAGKPQPSRYVSPNAYRHYLEARLLAARGDTKGALAQLRAALLFDERSPLLFTELGRALYRLTRLTEAEAAARKALTLRAAYPDALLLSGQIAERRKAPARALAHYRRCRREAPRFVPCGLRLAALLQRVGQAAAAQATLKTLSAQRPGDARVHERLGLLCLQQLDLRCAAKSLRGALARRTTLRRLLQLAMVHRASGDLKRATELLRETFDRSGGDPRAAARLLEVLRQRGAKQAIADLFAVLRAQTDRRPKQREALARLALQADRPADVLRLWRSLDKTSRTLPLRLTRAVALSRLRRAEARAALMALLTTPQGPAAALELARRSRRQSKPARAAALVEIALKHHPRNAGLLSALSDALFAAGAKARSLTVLERALAARSADPQLRFAYAGALERVGRWRDAIAQIEKLLAKRPRMAAAHNFIGYTLADRKHDLARAESELRTAMRLEPGRAYIVDSLGWLSYRRGKLAEARARLEIATRLAPREAEIAAHLAEVNAALARLPEAIKLYQHAIALGERPREIARWRARLKQLTSKRVGTR